MEAKRVRQVASEGHWLCTDISSDECLFAHVVLLAEGAALWAECSNEEKEQWEREHPQPIPEDAE